MLLLDRSTRMLRSCENLFGTLGTVLSVKTRKFVGALSVVRTMLLVLTLELWNATMSMGFLKMEVQKLTVLV